VSDVPKKTHNRDYFYKYRSAKAAIEILGKLEVCCSSPTIFNDPFDTMIELRLGFDSADFQKLLWERYQHVIHSEPDYSCPRTTKLGYLINYFRENPDRLGPVVHFEEVSSKFANIDSKATADRILSESNAIWMDYLQNERIFCMSETYDEILMWSHYADHHRGAVIEFKCLPNLDRAFNVADKIIYTTTIPKFGTFNQWFDHATGKKPLDLRELSKQYSFTKSMHWASEKEWRFALKKKSIDNKPYEFREVLPEELSAIYLGCKIGENEKDQIEKLIQRFLPHMKIFQAVMDKDEYQLHFVRMV
jgi:hypothetical protein